MYKIFSIFILLIALIVGYSLWSEIIWTIWWNSWITWVVVPDSTTLQKPSNITILPQSTSSLLITYSNVQWAIWYKIYKATNSTFDEWLSTINNWLNISYLDSWLTQNTTYFYKVSAVYEINWQTAESSLPTIWASWKTNAQILNLSWNTDQIINTLTWNWFQIWTWSYLLSDSNDLVWDQPIWIITWNIWVWIILVSRNSIEVQSWASIITWTAEVKLFSWLNISLTWWASFSWTINPPIFQSLNIADELSWSINIVWVIKVWNDNENIYFDSWVNVLMPVSWALSWDEVKVFTSIDWINWSFVWNSIVKIINWIPFVEFTTTHFSYFSVWESLPFCEETDYDIWEYSTCSNWNQTRTVTKKSTSSCNSESPNKPSTSNSCSISSSSSSSWWWGWWWFRYIYDQKNLLTTWSKENKTKTTQTWNNTKINEKLENIEEQLDNWEIEENTNKNDNLEQQNNQWKISKRIRKISKIDLTDNIQVELKIPIFWNEIRNQIVKNLNKKFLIALYKRKILPNDLNDIIENYNKFLLAMYLYKEEWNNSWWTIAKYYFWKIWKIFWNYKNITWLDNIDDDEFWYAITFLNKYGIEKTENINNFNKDEILTRQQVAKMLSLYATKVINIKPNTQENCNFQDIEFWDKSYQDYIKSSCQLWIMKWSNWLFFPYFNIKKSELITILIRTIYWKLDETNNIWFKEYIDKAIEIWLIKDTPNNKDYESIAQKDITKYELSLMLYRLYKIINKI